eukprot:CAMPEP_0206459196 /NCGR_PEP_ID=MMETSP0324_2-20121206/24032_1 /ASSEMBLY_ACC=CAM_ASM_000836 /TAXON_ID=2866 /ORGANISM="Crypthecodinium cohnii, Strain Seligo" /LENGTH=270 /DNA_ID=CAMNT_0053930701 /DNA_START=13 /DNA_END=825 /DNA_ORIENTATION=+
MDAPDVTAPPTLAAPPVEESLPPAAEVDDQKSRVERAIAILNDLNAVELARVAAQLDPRVAKGLLQGAPHLAPPAQGPAAAAPYHSSKGSDGKGSGYNNYNNSGKGNDGKDSGYNNYNHYGKGNDGKGSGSGKGGYKSNGYNNGKGGFGKSSGKGKSKGPAPPPPPPLDKPELLPATIPQTGEKWAFQTASGTPWTLMGPQGGTFRWDIQPRDAVSEDEKKEVKKLLEDFAVRCGMLIEDRELKLALKRGHYWISRAGGISSTVGKAEVE